MDQVQRAFARLGVSSELRQAAEISISIAKLNRERVGFIADIDYADIAYNLIQEMSKKNGSASGVLIIIGSGMLGRALATHPRKSTYSSVLAVSRWPKRLRQKLHEPDVKCIAPGDIIAQLQGANFDILAAVGQLTPDYKIILQLLLDNPNCIGVVDLSTTPITNIRRDSYIHEYDQEFCNYLTHLSSRMRQLVPVIHDHITKDVDAEF